MALATQCPHCQTTFRVAHDQLKLRAGLVRCGACKQIFNGIEHLLRPETTQTAAPTAAVVQQTVRFETTEVSVSPASPIPSTDLGRFGVTTSTEETEATEITDVSSSPTSLLEISVPSEHISVAEESPVPLDVPDFAALTPASDFWIDEEPVDPLQRMTLVNFTDELAELPASIDGNEMPVAVAIPPAHQTPDELDQAIDYLQRKPWRGKKKSVSREDIEGASAYDNDGYHATEEPGFVTRSRPRQRSADATWLLRMLPVLLLLGMLGEVVYLGRDQLAARLPQTKPWLEKGCNLVGCKIALLAQVDALSIESSELTTINPAQNTFALNLLLRNRSLLPQRWPSIELTLLDANDRPVVRRIFTQADYLTSPLSADSARGFPPNSEQPARIAFELRQQKAANYRAYLFYP